ncbi:hypothetical protein M2277_004971 [Paenibacillus sp. LBL]|uniref:hypothetical protein n=1 Tax=Paenibacillus sp. LBL TaxID=2940563 RepID=UPI0024732C66|nr:hypothetical protein [Paenibacillus sp. LBL]MDH6674279.1 hypothetical protein [Paenibacillus sp. LBL]
MSEVITTNHAKQRTKDRLGLSKKLTDKLAQKALDYGIKHSDTAGSLRRFMDSLYLSQRNANNIRIYNRKIYLFHDTILVTIINLPNKYSTLADKIQKRKVG